MSIVGQIGGSFQVTTFAGASNVIAKNLNPQHTYQFILKNGSNGTNGSWIAQTSQNADGSSPNTSNGTYLWSADQTTTDTGAFFERHSGTGGADTSYIGLQAARKGLEDAQWNSVTIEMLFDAGNGEFIGSHVGFYIPTGVIAKGGLGGQVLVTNAQSMIFSVSSGTFTGKLYIRDLG
jgi:hypothetical protein